MDKDYYKLLDNTLKSISLNLTEDERGIPIYTMNLFQTLLNNHNAIKGEHLYTTLELKSVIQKLIDDKYVYETISHDNIKYYKPTLDGYVFIQDKMYCGKISKDATKQIVNCVHLLLLSLAAVFAIYYYGVEIYKYYNAPLKSSSTQTTPLVLPKIQSK